MSAIGRGPLFGRALRAFVKSPVFGRSARGGRGWQDYFEQIRVLKTGLCLNDLAWNNGIGLRFYFVGSRNRSND